MRAPLVVQDKNGHPDCQQAATLMFPKRGRRATLDSFSLRLLNRTVQDLLEYMAECIISQGILLISKHSHDKKLKNSKNTSSTADVSQDEVDEE